MSRKINHYWDLTRLRETDGWCKGEFWSSLIYQTECSKKILRRGDKWKTFCLNGATYARWDVDTQEFEEPLCTQHFKKRETT